MPSADYTSEPEPGRPRKAKSGKYTRRKFLKTVGTGTIGLSAASVWLAHARDGGGDVPPFKEDAGDPPRIPPPEPAGDTVDVTLKINKNEQTFKIEPRVTLLNLLREHMGLYGTKKGCDLGQCGACTVLINGRSMNSCLALAVLYHGAEITTIEGLADGAELHPVQNAFIKHDAFQCGYCTSGQIMHAVALVNDGKQRTAGEIRECMSGNLCRCGAYPNIVAAVLDAQSTAAARPGGK